MTTQKKTDGQAHLRRRTPFSGSPESSCSSPSPGIVFGDRAIRDPGQRSERIPLFALYLAAAVVMGVNGVLSHRQTLQQHAEEAGDSPETP